MSSQENSSRKAAEIWDLGIKLFEAWFHLAGSDDKDRFRNSDQLQHSPNSVEIGLRIDLEARLESGELIAAGIEAGPTAHNGPILIGKHFFHEGAKIDWDAGSLTSHGISFLNLRVVRNPAWLDEPDEIGEFHAVAAAPAEIETKAIPKPRGRPRDYVLLQPIVRELEDSGQLRNKSFKEIENIIRSAAKVVFPNKFHSENSPDRKTINKALIAEGLK